MLKMTRPTAALCPDADDSHDCTAGRQAEVAANLQRDAVAEALGGEVHSNQVHKSHVDQDACAGYTIV